MRKFLSALLALTLLLSGLISGCRADEEEEIVYPSAGAAPAAEENGQPDASPQPTATPAPALQADGSVLLTITAVGNVTIGRNVQHKGASIFENELKKQNGDINFIFRNVKDIFAEDDLTIANFEGVLADDYTIPSRKKNNSFLFLAPTSYVEALRNNSVEAVTMENNHVGDFGEDGIASTIKTMDEAGIVWSNAKSAGYYEAQGVKIAMLAYQTLNQPISSEELKGVVASDIAAAKQTCDLVIVSFHWGEEKDYAPKSNQVMLGRAAIDAGADLVLGHHSHRINPIECYQGRYIVYSLANCSFAGNSQAQRYVHLYFPNLLPHQGRPDYWQSLPHYSLPHFLPEGLQRFRHHAAYRSIQHHNDSEHHEKQFQESGLRRFVVSAGMGVKSACPN